jgi:HSP20 family molecular chaperone IbpA
MAFVLTPRFAPAYQVPQCNPFGFCAPVSRPTYAYRVARPRPQRPQYSSFSQFFGQVDELLSEIEREAQRQAHLEAQREAHRQRQQRKRALRAKFAVNQTEQGWQVDGEIQGFDQENISIEITDEHTLKVAGNTEWQAEKTSQPEQQAEVTATPDTEHEAAHESSGNKIDGVTLNEPESESVTEADTATIGAATPDSDTESHKSYQATVEDDFEDLGAETSSLISSSSGPSSPTEVKEPKGKEKAVEEPAASETAVVPQPQPEVPVQQQPQEPQHDERVHGSFERTFRFPERIDAANVSASFKDGALRITVPRAQVQQIRRIAIL